MRLVVGSCMAALVAFAAWASGRYSASLADAVSSSQAAAGKGTTTAGDPGDSLIVHEWGTFTSFSGSDGVRLEFRPLLDEDLPPFVLDRFLQSGATNPWSKARIRVRMRMETPVTYFYTNRERDLNVRVSFPDGLLTEFYPPVEHMEPAYKFNEQLPLKGSSLDWGSIHLIPTDRFQARVDDPERRRLLERLMPENLVPVSDAKYHYGHARETDSALVHVRRPTHEGSAVTAQAPAGDFFEKFLFYRGVGNFELPLKLTSASDGTFELTNSGSDPIRSLFLVDIGEREVRFTAVDEITAGGRLKLVQSGQPTTIDTLGTAVQAALVREGLYEKEALAMVKTWQESWFGEAGTRLP